MVSNRFSYFKAAFVESKDAKNKKSGVHDTLTAFDAKYSLHNLPQRHENGEQRRNDQLAICKDINYRCPKHTTGLTPFVIPFSEAKSIIYLETIL